VEGGRALGALHVERDTGGSEERSDFTGHARRDRDNESRTDECKSRKAVAAEIALRAGRAPAELRR
jgi:hypothetical protein